ncbi:cysteine-rich KTR domain-containing protein [[Ruminococcus] torques]|uniref:cysteine-rich KTR domain-containing protein n=1 Tax=[Ruminococcus] torques TaxID=33039 RepID=UPI00210A3F8D|nr:cysteine-rich KTR domain-containing protein [[Ruminococcus] torques]MCQ5367399.1 cysteine-rich KTR domain-containing protein [[Ruminococcus] torques]
MEVERMEWIYCPNCNNKTRIKIRLDTELINFPLFCPKCRHETLINPVTLLAVQNTYHIHLMLSE